MQWAIWLAGGVVVPLSLSATSSEREYTLTDSGAACVLSGQEQAGEVQPLCERLGVTMLLFPAEPSAGGQVDLPIIETSRRAMILYTSGTTSKPKGVVSTHAMIEAQVQSLVEAWRWEASDRIPLFLPLHHIHGIINVLTCALWSGAHIQSYGSFDMPLILRSVAQHEFSLFMAVPTIYVKIIQYLPQLEDDERRLILEGFSAMRLMVSGSAALPASVHETWTTLTDQKLLERYGMTEIGMALSNPYDGERRPGAVGLALPGVEVRLRSEAGEIVDEENVAGEIQVRGPAVFREYWNRAEVTTESFDDGWFRTGDMAVVERGYYRILGRQSVDIIKSGGYKLSALEIEAVLLDHPSIRECAVVGVDDETWGEAVAAALVLEDGQSLSLQDLRKWCEDRISKYKIPKMICQADSLPRNAMGKVTKPAVRELF